MRYRDPSLPFYLNDAEDFIRIAEARLKSEYRFPPQRKAIAAKMLMRWLERKRQNCISEGNNENFFGIPHIIQ